MVAIDLPARNHCSPGDCENIPSGLSGTSVLFLPGERDPLSPSDAVDTYCQAVPDGLLKAMGMVGIGCRNGVEGFLLYVTAWLVRYLEIDPAAERVFTGPDAAFLVDPGLSGTDLWP